MFGSARRTVRHILVCDYQFTNLRPQTTNYSSNYQFHLISETITKSALNTVFKLTTVQNYYLSPVTIKLRQPFSLNNPTVDAPELKRSFPSQKNRQNKIHKKIHFKTLLENAGLVRVLSLDDRGLVWLELWWGKNWVSRRTGEVEPDRAIIEM